VAAVISVVIGRLNLPDLSHCAFSFSAVCFWASLVQKIAERY